MQFYFNCLYSKNCQAKIKGIRTAKFNNHLVEILNSMNEKISKLNCEGWHVRWYKRRTQKDIWQPVLNNTIGLETEFRKSAGKGVVQFDFDNSGPVTIDFDQMNVLVNNTVLYNLKRKEDSDCIPLEWNWNGKLGKEEYTLVLIDQNSSEFNDIKTEVFKTRSNITINKIERVENPIRYRQYNIVKQKMEQSNKDGTQIERKLFHGTPPQNVSSICRDGYFDRGLCGQHGVEEYGKGAYFARDFAYSANYGNTVFYAYVLTGKFTVGNPSMRNAPLFDPLQGIKYDSVVDNVQNPSIFVVFSDTHAYPCYLITYS